MTGKDKGRGRPSKYQPAYSNMLIEHLAEGASIASFAAEIGVARSTINQWAEDNEDFSEALKIGKAKDGSAVAWRQFADDEIPPHRTCEVDDVDLCQPVGFVWFHKPRYRVKARHKLIEADR